MIEPLVVGEFVQAPRRDQTHYCGCGQADVEDCGCLEVVVVATLSEPVSEADAGVVAFADVARIAEVEAIEADTADVVGDVEVHEVLVAGADDQAGALPQEGGQVDQGGEEDGQVADEEGGEGRHQVRVRL